MNGKTAKMLRAHAQDAGTSGYEVMPGTQRRKFDDTDPMYLGRGVDTCTIRLNQACGRKRYQNLKRRYKAARRGETALPIGKIAWLPGL